MKQLYADYKYLLNTSLKEDLFLQKINSSIPLNKDITTHAFLSYKKNFQKKNVTATFIAKEKMVVCGIVFLKHLSKNILKDFKSNFFVKEGEVVNKGTVLLTWQGEIAKILIFERNILNLFQYLCGIATGTKETVEFTKKINSKIQILDTRKILPGFRRLAKYAVKIGGAENHRMGLYDMFLIKENHWQLAEHNQISLKEVIQKMKGAKKKIEIECNTKKKVMFLLENKLPIDIIMLDNMKVNLVKEMITLIKIYNKKNNKKIKIEVSGNLNQKKIISLKGLAVDYISLGKLTHSVTSSDISLNIT